MYRLYALILSVFYYYNNRPDGQKVFKTLCQCKYTNLLELIQIRIYRHFVVFVCSERRFRFALMLFEVSVAVTNPIFHLHLFASVNKVVRKKVLISISCIAFQLTWKKNIDLTPIPQTGIREEHRVFNLFYGCS